MAKSANSTAAVAAASPNVTSLVPKDDAALLAQMEQDADAGFEEANQDSFAIPFLVRLQDLSPQVKPKMAGFIAGAKPGMILQSVSQELFTECRVIPCYFSQVFIEWTPRETKGSQGLVAIHPAETPLAKQIQRDDRNQPVLPNGNLLVDTRQHFVLLQRPNGLAEQALISCSSTAIKHSRRWMSQMRAASLYPMPDGRIIKLPSFAWSYRLSTEEEANDQGSWFAWHISDRERVTDLTTYNLAKAFNAQMRAGAVRVNYEELNPSGGAAHAAGVDAPPGDLDDNELDA